jgi:hypothetical protein
MGNETGTDTDIDTGLERMRRSAVRWNVTGLVAATCVAVGIVAAHRTGWTTTFVTVGMLAALGLFCAARVMLLVRIHRAGR